jgi:hypothetical protein
MTVGQMIECLCHLPKERQVYVVFAAEDERPATCVTSERNYVRICDSSAEVSINENILFDAKWEAA